MISTDTTLISDVGDKFTIAPAIDSRSRFTCGFKFYILVTVVFLNISA